MPTLHVDYFDQVHNAQHADVNVWQERMARRGWKISTDGIYGSGSEQVCREFQSEKDLGADGKVGPKTWAAAWTAAL
ncbi:MAG TPA: peptidoglycan-binding domain-containing protein, partial [Solirubrobacteraceae bacterium]